MLPGPAANVPLAHGVHSEEPATGAEEPGAHGCGTNGQPSRYSTSHDGESGLSCTSFCSGNDAPVVDCRFNGGHTVERFMPSLMWEFFSKHVNEHVLGSNATTASA